MTSSSFTPKPPRAEKPQMTLDRVLSRHGVASRTVAAAMIRAGRVTVEGRRVTDPEVWVDPRRQAVRLDGERLQAPARVYLALHKPCGYLTSHGDPRGRPTVYDLLAGRGGPAAAAAAEGKRSKTGQRRRQLGAATRGAEWLFPVGRLDQETSGLLLMTNDSVFAERVTNPRTKLAKTYHVQVDAGLTEEELRLLRAGLEIGRGERSGPAEARLLAHGEGSSELELVICEGKNRQVRRMIEALGHPVLGLRRTQIGRLKLAGLREGEWREIRPEEVMGSGPKAAAAPAGGVTKRPGAGQAKGDRAGAEKPKSGVGRHAAPAGRGRKAGRPGAAKPRRPRPTGR